MLQGPTRDDEPVLGDSHRHGSSITLFLFLALIAAMGTTFYFKPQLLFGNVVKSEADYKELGIQNLPLAINDDRTVQPYLSRLQTESCDQTAVAPLAESLTALGALRQASDVLVSFVSRCKGPIELLDPAVENLLSLGDFQQAYEQSEKLVQGNRAYGRYRFLRARAEEKLGKLQESLADHLDALALLGDPSNVHSSVFYEVALAYDRLGRHCEAITPLQQWASYDPERDNPQTRKIIQEFSDKGNCGSDYAKAAEVFSVPAFGNVIIAKVKVNGVEGKFVVDTGATFVSLTKDFAQRAGIAMNGAPSIELLTAAGPSSGLLTSADKMEVGPVSARNISVAVADGLKDCDGLLGMSFLARFDISLTPQRLEIRAAK